MRRCVDGIQSWPSKVQGRSGRRDSGKWNQHVKNGDGWLLQTKRMTRGSKDKASGKGKGQGTGETETRHCYDCGQQGHLVLNCPYTWHSSWDDEPEEEGRKCWRVLEVSDEGGNWRKPCPRRITRWRRAKQHANDEYEDWKPSLHWFAEDGDGEQRVKNLSHLVRGDAGGTQWTWRKVTVVVGPCAAENVVQRSMFLEVVVEETELSKSGKGFQGVGGGKHRESRSAGFVSVHTRGFVRKSTWQVADVGRPLVSASHIIQAGSDALHCEKFGLQIETMEKGETDAEEGGQCLRIRLVREGSSLVPTHRSSTDHGD